MSPLNCLKNKYPHLTPDIAGGGPRNIHYFLCVFGVKLCPQFMVKRLNVSASHTHHIYIDRESPQNVHLIHVCLV